MPEKATVVIVHGLWMTGVETFLIKRHLKAQTDWPTASFNYASVRDSLPEIVAQLADFVDRQPAGDVHFVGHSLGGVVIHELAHTLGLPRPGRAVLLCSPIQGSAVAATVARVPLARRVLGKAVCETLIAPARRTWQADAEAGVIAGIRSVGLGRTVGHIDVPNDGTVSLCETELPGATDAIALPVSHTSALFSARVAAQIAFFLSHGRFRR
ncbi:MAG: alpha/beta fold hydrolase [Gammaproteobacteria bacterium]|nr:alpha/beta fold hydrolase [Gammaproteobacteria bacterium]